jgi:hypothetical protein
MKRIIIDLDDDYATVLSLTAIGLKSGTNITTTCVDLRTTEHIVLNKDNDGNMSWEKLEK